MNDNDQIKIILFCVLVLAVAFVVLITFMVNKLPDHTNQTREKQEQITPSIDAVTRQEILNKLREIKQTGYGAKAEIYVVAFSLGGLFGIYSNNKKNITSLIAQSGLSDTITPQVINTMQKFEILAANIPGANLQSKFNYFYQIILAISFVLLCRFTKTHYYNDIRSLFIKMMPIQEITNASIDLAMDIESFFDDIDMITTTYINLVETKTELGPNYQELLTACHCINIFDYILKYTKTESQRFKPASDITEFTKNCNSAQALVVAAFLIDHGDTNGPTINALRKNNDSSIQASLKHVEWLRQHCDFVDNSLAFSSKQYASHIQKYNTKELPDYVATMLVNILLNVSSTITLYKLLKEHTSQKYNINTHALNDFKSKADNIKELITERGNIIKFFTDEVLVKPDDTPIDVAIKLYSNGYNAADEDIAHVHVINESTFHFNQDGINQIVFQIKMLEANELISNYITYNVDFNETDQEQMIHYISEVYKLPKEISEIIFHAAMFTSNIMGDDREELLENDRLIRKVLVNEGCSNTNINNMIKAVHNILHPKDPKSWLNADHEQRGKLYSQAMEDAGIVQNKTVSIVLKACRVIILSEYKVTLDILMKQVKHYYQ